MQVRPASDDAASFPSEAAATFPSELPIEISAQSVGRFGAMAQALYLVEAGDSAAVAQGDIHQGQIGDCYLLSPLGDLAAKFGSLVQNMIHANGDGTETVTLYRAANGSAAMPGATAFKAVTETVKNVFPTDSVNNGASQDVVNGTKEIWAQVVENAFAQAGGGYAAIGRGGNPAMAMEELTGHTAYCYNPAGITASALASFVNAKDIITFDTRNGSSLGYNLVGGHAYMFNAVVNTANGPAVSLANPWGFDQPSLIPISKLSSVFAEVDVGKTA